MWGTKVWINMDGLEWARGKWGTVARRYLRMSEAIAMWTPDRIIADAAAIKTNLQSRYRRLPPCDVIPYGCEVVSGACAEEVKGFGLTPGSYYLVVCRFEPENHVAEIMEGYLRTKTEKRLVLVGDCTRKSAYVDSLRRHKSERILFTGSIYDAPRIRALRYFCAAYVHGHSVGGTNPSLLEAMGCGNAVIAHDNQFNREVLGGSGIFFSTPSDISTAIDSVDSEKVDVAGMKAKAVERAKQFYTWERITDHYCELVELVSSKSKSRGAEIHCAPLLPKETTGLRVRQAKSSS
jgi:glycosyltransferase involved in cell wall biosynthesis